MATETFKRDVDQNKVEVYKNLAAIAAEYEFRLRLLANQTPDLQKYAAKSNFTEIEKKVFKKFQSEISEEERVFLATTPELRNKVIHGEFSVLVDMARSDIPFVPINVSAGEEYAENEMKKDFFSDFLSFISNDQMDKIVATFQKSIKIINDLASLNK